MIDKYSPPLSSFVLTPDEQAAVNQAFMVTNPWDWKPKGDIANSFNSVKKKIIDMHLKRHKKRCCYCRSDLHGGGHFRIDREHVLPKQNPLFKSYTFSVWNLAAACKRCNMQYKGKKTDFIVDAANVADFKLSENYLFIHPSFDLYEEHISFLMINSDHVKLVKYTVLNDSAKGEYTYQYFNLRGLEVDSFDDAQGRNVSTALGDLSLLVKRLSEKMDQ